MILYCPICLEEHCDKHYKKMCEECYKKKFHAQVQTGGVI